MNKVSFGEWIRWTLARRGYDRAGAAKELGVSASTISNIYGRDVPDGINDVTLSKLAELLGMEEPVLMVEWKKGLPTRKGKQ